MNGSGVSVGRLVAHQSLPVITLAERGGQGELIERCMKTKGLAGPINDRWDTNLTAAAKWSASGV